MESVQPTSHSSKIAVAKKVITESVQRDAYSEEYMTPQESKFMRISGCLKNASFEPKVKNPIIVPKHLLPL